MEEGAPAYQEAIQNAAEARGIYDVLVEASGDLSISDEEFDRLVGLVEQRPGNARDSYDWTSVPAVSPLFVDRTGLAVVFHRDEADEVFLRLMDVAGEFHFIDDAGRS